ncbi:unnamed protein product [Caretta caretta]
MLEEWAREMWKRDKYMLSNREWRNRWASTRTKVNVEMSSGWWLRCGQALFGPQAVPLLKGGVKVPTQDQALMRIQGAEEGGCLLIELQPLRARCRGIDVNEVDHKPLHTDSEVQQVAQHSLGDPQHLGP